MFPLFSDSSFYDAFCGLFRGNGLGSLIALTAILVAGIICIAILFMHHRERMAMIERGIHPDYKDEEPPTTEASSESLKTK
jgi:hypothetical protein